MNDYIEDFFESVYNAEIEQKQKLDTADSFLVGIVAALMGVGAYYLQTMAKAEFGFALCGFWLISVPYFVALLVALVFVALSIWPREKNYIASPKEWAAFVDGYAQHYSFWHKGPDLSKKVALELAALRRQQYIEAGETNRVLILRKHGYQTWAKRWIIGAVVLMLLCAIPVYFVQRAEYRAKKNVKPTTTASSPSPAASADSTTANVAPSPAGPANRDAPNGGGSGAKEVITEATHMPEQDKGGSPSPTPETPAAPPKPDAPPITKVYAGRELSRDKLPPASPPVVPPTPPPSREQ